MKHNKKIEFDVTNNFFGIGMSASVLGRGGKHIAFVLGFLVIRINLN